MTAASLPLARAVARPSASPRYVAWGLAIAGLVLWSLMAVGSHGTSGGGTAENVLVYGVPGVAFLVVLLSRPHSPPLARFVLVWTATVVGALEGLDFVGASLTDAVAPLAAFVAGALALRWPIPTLLLALFLSGTYNTIRLYTPVETGLAMDLALAGAWLAVVFAWLSGRREPPAYISPAMFLLGFYIAVTLAGALLQEDMDRSLYAFRSSAWLMSVVFLVPMWASEERRRTLMHRGALVVGLIVAAYAMLRWAIGPGDKEEARVLYAPSGGGYTTNDIGEVRVLGSLPSPQGLAVWSSAMFAFALASTLSPIGRFWRLLAAVVTAGAGASLFGADVRFGMVAAVAGGLAVLVIFATARGFSGQRALPLALVIVLAAVGTGVFVTTKLQAEGSSGERFRNLVTDPIADNSVQQRFLKWETMLAEVDKKPFGRGLGSSGAAERKYARFVTAASVDPDSSYIKLIYDQGFLVLVLFGAALVALIGGLALAALGALDPLRAASALGGCGALVAFAVAMSGANYFEGLAAVGPWSLTAIGCATLVRQRARSTSQRTQDRTVAG